MNDDQVRDLLREMREEPVPADSAARVRQAVTARIEARPRGWWKLGLAAAVAACVIVAVVWWRPAETASPVVVMQPGPTPALPAPPPEPVTPPPPRAPRPKPVAAPQPAFITTANPSMTIRIETDDPEIVILLVN